MGSREKIIRVFPSRTNLTPTDDYCFFDSPGLFIPPHDEVHICCVFTWDIPKAEKLWGDWRTITGKPVFLGGPAVDDPRDSDADADFIPGMYVKHGVTFTSRGCPNDCSFCLVPKREGKLREIEIKLGNIINDNNFLACSKEHRRKVYDMLKNQKAIEFKGGLEAERLTEVNGNDLRDYGPDQRFTWLN